MLQKNTRTVVGQSNKLGYLVDLVTVDYSQRLDKELMLQYNELNLLRINFEHVVMQQVNLF